jgi:hypothetical protein
MKPEMYFFGPWERAGHYLHREDGCTDYEAEKTIPWTLGQLDGGIQPHLCGKEESGKRCYGGTCAPQGIASVHHKDGWTALAFWDSSVDHRSGCVSVYLAKGDFDFTQIVDMAKMRFAKRWNKMPFDVLYRDADGFVNK